MVVAAVGTDHQTSGLATIKWAQFVIAKRRIWGECLKIAQGRAVFEDEIAGRLKECAMSGFDEPYWRAWRGMVLVRICSH